MRADMDKVVIERPRTNRDGSQRLKRQERREVMDSRSFEDAPSKMTMRPGRRFGYDGKELSDLINPLRRYLAKQVGRPWDKVHSEIVSTLKGGTTSGQHIRGHVKGFVKLPHEVVKVDGVVCHAPSVYGGRTGLPLRGGALYVDDHGILRKAPSHWHEQYQEKTREDFRTANPAHPDFTVHQRGDRTYIRRTSDGVYFEAHLTEVPRLYASTYAYIPRDGGIVGRTFANGTKIISSIRTLNKAEKKALGFV